MMSPFDSRQVRRAFSRAAPDYAASAVLQAEVRARLLEQLAYLPSPPQRIVDLGCGPGAASKTLRQRWPKAEVLALDLALPMLREAKRQFSWRRRFERLCADARALPLADQSVDLIFSNLCVQWVDDLPALFAEWRRVLRPKGLLLLSTFTQGTLQELREAFASADGEQPHVSPFATIQKVGDALLGAGFRDPVLDSDRFTLTYTNATDLMRELKAIGAGNADSQRRRSLTGKARMQRVRQAYEHFRQDGRLPASYEVAYAQAWGPEPGQPRRQGGAEIAAFPVDQLRIRRRR
ncbi:malonyl-ACP O-methyltransferase BioC [Pseudomarimonas arenosa]|uniref:Malonyl-[acyl-carrier protein] O-methyltransferase n=1 Tax=Pseudomarimonas arenosa TaxID=2774145 RepID=A0AAW3ZTS6_9GAMM|nr:malonyl-ACP O-methyltransferase BioC [Pseudomarimonas arenosa]MBD8527909.1 malonyl-ACP O-methyltransferase BioC [Pseudomarimonas arenosa]